MAWAREPSPAASINQTNRTSTKGGDGFAVAAGISEATCDTEVT